MGLALAWLRRAALEELSYRGHLALQAVGGLVTLAGVYYLGRLVPLSALGGGYFAFACVGLAAYLPARAAQAEIAQGVRQAQLVGLLEPLAASPAGLPAQLCAMGIWPTIGALARAASTLAAGALVFGLSLSLSPRSLAIALAAGLLGAVASLGLGLLSAALVLHVRRSDPIAYLLDSAAWLGSGLLFPTRLLPPWARRAGELLPATHVLRVARAALLPSSGGEARGSMLALGLLALSCPLLGAAALRLSIRAARRRGSFAIP